MKAALIGLNIDRFLMETEKAIRVEVRGYEVWVAKKLIYNLKQVLSVSRDRGRGIEGQDFFMEIPPWLAKKIAP